MPLEPLDRDPVRAVQTAVNTGGMKLFQVVPAMIERIIQDDLWHGRADAQGRPFASFMAFAEAPQWEGLGVPLHRLCDWCHDRPEVVRLIQTSVPEMPTHAEAGAKGGRANKAGDDVTSFGRGNSTAYLAARLKRDRPDLLAEVAEGRRSVRDAAKAAGIVKPPDVYRDLCRAWRKASEDQRAAFENYIAEWRRSEAA